MLLVGAVGQIEVGIWPTLTIHLLTCHLSSQIRAELPKITEDSVAQVSRDKHESLADIFSLTVEDIPPMVSKHTAAVGLNMVLLLLDFVETKDGKYAELCQMMRSYIASYLTDDERTQFLS
jgi:hypothetical protein